MLVELLPFLQNADQDLPGLESLESLEFMIVIPFPQHVVEILSSTSLESQQKSIKSA